MDVLSVFYQPINQLQSHEHGKTSSASPATSCSWILQESNDQALIQLGNQIHTET